MRPAVPADGAEFLRLVEELAVFEKLTPPDEDARRRLLGDAFEAKRFELFVADDPDHEGRLALYAIVVWTYSSFLAKPTLYLEDIYVTPAARGTGLAEDAMRFLANLALDRGAGRLEGIVLDWNERARRFYRRTGVTEMEDWVFFRYDEAALTRLADRRPS